MRPDSPSTKRSPPDSGSIEESEAKASVMRPVPRRITARSPAPDATKAAGTAPNFPSVPSATLSNPALQPRKSAWAKYESPASSQSPPHHGISPPPGSEKNMATHEAARKLWERLAANESEATETATPPAASSPTANSPQPGPLPGGLLQGLQAARQLGMQQQMQAYLNAYLNGQLGREPGLPNAVSCDLPRPAGTYTRPPAFGALMRPKAERANPNPANGSLSILPEAGHAAAAPNLSMPLTAPLAGLSSSAQISRFSRQLEDILRDQAMAHQPSAQLPLLSSEPMYGGAASLPINSHPPHPSFARYGSQEPNRDGGLYHLGAEGESLSTLPPNASNAARAVRRWNSAGSMASDASLYNMGSYAGPQMPHNMMNIPGQDSQGIMQALQMLVQANEMAALANSKIQASVLAASANLEAVASNGMRKRKATDYYEDAPKRHNSVLSDGDNYPSYNNGSHPQRCAECGTTNTPTWRRSGKRLMCNACGLRRSRSMRSARSNSMPVAAADAQPTPKIETPNA